VGGLIRNSHAPSKPGCLLARGSDRRANSPAALHLKYMCGSGGGRTAGRAIVAWAGSLGLLCGGTRSRTEIASPPLLLRLPRAGLTSMPFFEVEDDPFSRPSTPLHQQIIPAAYRLLPPPSPAAKSKSVSTHGLPAGAPFPLLWLASFASFWSPPSPHARRECAPCC
jgi:hypothetical protein